MKIKDLLDLLNTRYPFEDAEQWDNTGLLLGSEEDETNNIYVSLDLTSKGIEFVPEGSTIITHHPLIFSPLKEINFDSYEGKLIKMLIKKDITYIALHTNYDKHFLNQYFIETILKKEINKKQGFLDYFYTQETTLGEFRFELSEKMNCTRRELKLVGNIENKIRKVAVCTGSASSEMREAKANGADLLLTGDITYHTAMEALEIGISLIDITHFHSEKWFGTDLTRDLGYIKLDQENPFK